MSERHTGSGGTASRWDERYSQDDYVFGTEPNGFLASLLAMMSPGAALCIADGEGRNSVFLAEHGFLVTAMDASAVGMVKARRLAAQRGVELRTQVADLRDFDFGEESWDIIVSIFCHLPPELRRDVHRRVVRALRPGGIFVLEAYTPEQLRHGTGGPGSAELLMTLPDLRDDLDGLHLEIGREIERDVVEGCGHTGRASVVQVAARRR